MKPLNYGPLLEAKREAGARPTPTAGRCAGEPVLHFTLNGIAAGQLVRVPHYPPVQQQKTA